jgi:hypothetical protein
MRFRERRSRGAGWPFEAPEEGPAALFALNAGNGAAMLCAGAGALLAIGVTGTAVTARAIFGATPSSGALDLRCGAANAPTTSTSPVPAPRLADAAFTVASARPSADRARVIHALARRASAAKRSRRGSAPSPNGTWRSQAPVWLSESCVDLAGTARRAQCGLL